MASRLQWETDGRDWPNRCASHFVDAAGLRWHLQQFGPAADRAPCVVLLHGTGSSSHSWRDVAPLLGLRYSVLSLDLPGHGFTSAPASAAGQSLPGMASRVAALLAQQKITPQLLVGHSAGAAIAARMVLDGAVSPQALLSINGAFLGFGGLAGALFSPLARLLSSGDLAARFFAARAADPAFVQKLLRGTGSAVDDTGLRLYARLLQSPAHVGAALAMMAHWDLRPLERELPRMPVPVTLVAAGHDLTVPPSQAQRVASRLPRAERVSWPRLGHLAHEENPALCLALITSLMESRR